MSASFSVFFGFLSGHLHLLCHHDQPFGGLRGSVEYHVFHTFQQLRLYLIIYLQHGRIDYGHVKSGLYRMVKKCGMHGFADRIVASECK